MNEEQVVYIVGLQQYGGCWNWTGEFFNTYEAALDRRNHKDEKIFSFYTARPRLGKLAQQEAFQWDYGINIVVDS